ncbi:hypothetical protein GOV05_04245 [Candidatus Woesearchaeota archaeon]|nr:hypothetical protein [Candidatus Woesearchaeota archaeon]
MRTEIKQILKNTRVIILFVFLLLAIISIHPSPNNTGVIIKSVVKNGPANLAGVPNPKPQATPLSKEVIQVINNININDEQDYYQVISGLVEGQSVSLKTNKNIYTLNLVNTTPDNILGLLVNKAPKTNIRKGLDLQGGTRVLLAPEEKVDVQDMGFLIDNMKQRLNIYGLSDIVVRQVSDSPGILGGGNQYILVEIAGANEEEVRELIASQGKFEAKIANKTVFKGGQDISHVCRTAQCSGLDQRRPCQPTNQGWLCGFFFEVTLTPESAKRQADITKDLSIILSESNDEILNETLVFFLDGEIVTELNIVAELKGKATTSVAITGASTGVNREEALTNTLNEMKQLQTVLVTGSLPVKLEILKTDNLSPILGEEFLNNALLIGFLSILTVALVIFLRYRKIEVSVPVVVTMLSEIVILLGLAALIGWNLDLAAIAGIIIAAGTGVDHQIVITDETLKGLGGIYLNWKQKLKRAFSIIMAAYFTTVVAMIPLTFAGAGLLKGFAFTTIMGTTIGVLITRPAFAEIISILLKK